MDRLLYAAGFIAAQSAGLALLLGLFFAIRAGVRAARKAMRHG